jgi:hypothetical protein
MDWCGIFFDVTALPPVRPYQRTPTCCSRPLRPGSAGRDRFPRCPLFSANSKTDNPPPTQKKERKKASGLPVSLPSSPSSRARGGRQAEWPAWFADGPVPPPSPRSSSQASHSQTRSAPPMGSPPRTPSPPLPPRRTRCRTWR